MTSLTNFAVNGRMRTSMNQSIRPLTFALFIAGTFTGFNVAFMWREGIPWWVHALSFVAFTLISLISTRAMATEIGNNRYLLPTNTKMIAFSLVMAAIVAAGIAVFTLR